MNKLIVAGICFFLSIPQVSEHNIRRSSREKYGTIRKAIRLMRMEEASCIMKARITGTESIRKGKRYCPNGLRGVLSHRCDGRKLLFFERLAELEVRRNRFAAVKDDPNHDLHPSKVLERPKVIYNRKTGKFVMWAHVESADYSKACAGVAVSDSPAGPFTYLGSFRPNDAMSRDQTVFVDDDGRAYQFYSSENNATMYISLLTDDYLSFGTFYT